MPAVHRETDICTGHGCFGSRPSCQGSPDTFVNNLPAHRETDAWSAHCCGPPCHGSILSAGSPDTFVNNLALGRIGDPVACGSVCATGSPDTFCN
jgi:uncharacterized Zn-binding protein involved in type VI secretion